MQHLRHGRTGLCTNLPTPRSVQANSEAEQRWHYIYHVLVDLIAFCTVKKTQLPVSLRASSPMFLSLSASHLTRTFNCSATRRDTDRGHRHEAKMGSCDGPFTVLVKTHLDIVS